MTALVVFLGWLLRSCDRFYFNGSATGAPLPTHSVIALSVIVA